MADTRPLACDRSYEDIKRGERVSFSRIVGPSEVEAFAALTGDWNPLHMDAQYAAATKFEKRIVHGMLLASYFSTLVGMYLPGRKALLLSQEARFVKPVYLDEEVTFLGEVRSKTDSLQLLDIDARVVNKGGEEVVSGRIQVMVLP